MKTPTTEDDEITRMRDGVAWMPPPVASHDFEPYATWSMSIILQGLLRSLCDNCKHRPVDRLTCSQKTCYRRECMEDRLAWVEMI